MQGNNMKKICALGAALAIAMTMGLSALAEEADEVTADATEIVAVEEQATAATAQDSAAAAEAKEAALAAYDAAVDAVLDEMVSAGALTQEVADSYRAQRNAQRQISKMDTSNWTLDQISALKQAIRGKSVNETILAGLVSQGVITQEDVDMFKLAYSESVNIWGQVDSSKATEGMMTKLQEARMAYQQALTDAGLSARSIKGGIVSDAKSGVKQGTKNNRGRSGK